jgi:hypothetical protein
MPVLEPADWAGKIYELRYRLPQYVRDLLDDVESRPGDTCNYYPLIPKLLHVAYVSEMIRGDNKDVIRRLIHIIRDADENEILIPKPLYKENGNNISRRVRPNW